MSSWTPFLSCYGELLHTPDSSPLFLLSRTSALLTLLLQQCVHFPSYSGHSLLQWNISEWPALLVPTGSLTQRGVNIEFWVWALRRGSENDHLALVAFSWLFSFGALYYLWKNGKKHTSSTRKTRFLLKAQLNH
jgi:hypothetical protein